MFHTRFTCLLSAMLIACCPLVTWGQNPEPAPGKDPAAGQPVRRAEIQQIPRTVYQSVPRKTVYQAVPQEVPLMQGYFLSDEQLKKLSPQARAELEKLLKARAVEATRAKVHEQMVQEQLESARAALAEAVTEHERALAEQQQKYRYMIGVAVEPNEGNDDGGVIVSKVVEDSPAERAGVAPGEVILSVKGMRKVSNPHDLIEAVEAAEGDTILLRLKTYGKDDTERSLEIVPVERPEKFETGKVQVEELDAETRKQWEQALKQYHENHMRFRAIHPGIYWDQAALQQDLPENVTITVSKSGKAPAKITVTRDADSWNMNETEVDQLPEDLRGPVKRLLTRPGLKIWDLHPVPAVPAQSPSKVLKSKVAETQKLQEMQALGDRQVQQLQQQLDALQKAVEKLQQEQKKE